MIILHYLIIWKQQITHLVAAASAFAVIYWRYQHPNKEHTVERKVFYSIMGVSLVWNLVAVFMS